MSPPLDFESRRFRSAASHYLAGRPPYAPSLIRRVADLCGLTDEHRVLDLGCGPGQLSIAFAFFAGSVVALDPEPEMLRIAAEAATGLAPNVEFIEASSHDLPGQLGRFRMVVIGRAFHWMDRAETLRRLDVMVEREGAVVLFHDDHLDVPDNGWLRHYEELLDRHSDDDSVRARHRSPDWVRHEAILLDSAFGRLERLSVIERRQTPVDRLVDRALSQSSTSRARLGPKTDQLVAEIGHLMAEIAPGGIVTEVIESSALIARLGEPRRREADPSSMTPDPCRHPSGMA
jgi:SAM-dependent methyltransferase